MLTEFKIKDWFSIDTITADYFPPGILGAFISTPNNIKDFDPEKHIILIKSPEIQDAN